MYYSPPKAGSKRRFSISHVRKKKKPNYMTLKSSQNRGSAQLLWASDFWRPTRIQPSSTLWDYLKVWFVLCNPYSSEHDNPLVEMHRGTEWVEGMRPAATNHALPWACHLIVWIQFPPL